MRVTLRRGEFPKERAPSTDTTRHALGYGGVFFKSQGQETQETITHECIDYYSSSIGDWVVSR